MRKNKFFTQKNLEKNITHLLFVSPLTILYTFLSIFPIFLGIYYSFTNWNGIAKKYTMVGLKNYIAIFSDARFIRALKFNFKYSLLLMFFIVIISFTIALILNRSFKGRTFFRALYFFPAVISMLTAGLIFNELYYRAIPLLGEMLNISFLKSNILASSKTAIYGVLITHVWQGVAIPTVLFLSGLQTVPTELYESAMIDGANKFDNLRYITIPFIIPVLSVILVLTLKDGLTVFDYIYGMTGGGPAGSTESLTLLLYKLGFEEMKYSYGLALSILVSLIIMAISFAQIAFVNKRKIY